MNDTSMSQSELAVQVIATTDYARVCNFLSHFGHIL